MFGDMDSSHPTPLAGVRRASSSHSSDGAPPPTPGHGVGALSGAQRKSRVLITTPGVLFG